jgi:hypothetical protein
MNREHYKSTRKNPKRNSKISTIKSLMLATAKKSKPTPSPKLREAYSTKIEWATKIIPKLKEK